MRVLVLGGGGREHALVWKLAQSPLLNALFAMPGSDAIGHLATCLPGDAAHAGTVLQAVTAHHIDLVIVGPEAPLIAGVTDALRAAGHLVFGPSADAAQLEGSKAFTKAICQRAGIATAHAVQVRTAEAAVGALDDFDLPVVIKADGLAAGKGVIIAEDCEDAEQAIGRLFADYGPPLLIEEFLVGDEMSFFALSDGQHVLPFGTAEDHKAIFDGDTGPNTGGMGAFSPSRLADMGTETHLVETFIQPTVDAMAAANMPFVGVLYAGLMMTGSGPKLLEYNARFGDPECQVLMMRLKSDLLPIVLAAAKGALNKVDTPIWSDGAAATVVMAAKGYPGAYEKGDVITGAFPIEGARGSIVFHAGTKLDGHISTANGGRVLNISASGADIEGALSDAYSRLASIDWPNGHYRGDIGRRTYKTIANT